MKKKLLTAISLLLCFLPSIYAQTGAITSSITIAAEPIFIQGASGFENILTVSNVPANAQTVWLCQLDTQDEVIDSTAATLESSDWVDTLDMGELDSSIIKIVAHYYDSGDNYLDASDPYLFSVKPEPAAIQSSLVEISVDSIDAQGIAAIEITVSVPDSVKPIDDGIVGIGGKKFGFEYNHIVLKRDYDLNTGLVNPGTDNSYQYQLNAFGKEVASDEISLDGFANLNIGIDTNFNPIVEGHFNAVKEFFKYETRDATLPLPISPASVSIGAGLSLSGGFAADCYLGIDNTTGDFGFIQKPSGERTTISIGAKIEGSVRVTGSLVSKHLVGIRASLTAIGRIGASYEFQTVPAFQDSFKFGGDLLIKGNVQLTGLGGKAKELWCSYNPFSSCEPNNTVLDGVIWPRNNNDLPRIFGDALPASLDTLYGSALSNYNNHGSRSAEVDSNYLFDIPDACPQPAFANRGSSIAVAWVESDSISEHLLFSTLDTLQNNFTLPVEIAQNDVMLIDPKVALAPDGSSIIVWAQSSYATDSINASTDIDKLIEALDVWYAVYDPLTGTITTKSRIYNPVDFPASKPGIAISDSGKAIITWLALDTASSFTDIWYAELVNGNGIWYQSTPEIINELPGNNYNVNVCFTDSVNAIAAWITDTDGDDSTGGNQIIASYYDGDSWSSSSPISDQSNDEKYHELSLDFNGDYGAIAYTSTTYGDEGEQVNSIKAEFYHQGQWDETNYYEYTDSLKYVRMPRVSISDKEFAAVSYQTVDMYDESSIADAGQINIAMKDLNNSTDWDSIDFSTVIAQDTSIFVWDMDVVLGRNNMLYTLSQESDTIIQALYGGQYMPHTGSLFGNASMGMVLRGLKINPDLSVDADSTSSLPTTPTGLREIAVLHSESLGILVYPNPFKDNATFEYSLPESGQTRLEIFDLMGRSVAMPVNQFLGSGNHKSVFQSDELTGGIYVLRITSGGLSKTTKLMLK